jgi:hypothetical protein
VPPQTSRCPPQKRRADRLAQNLGAAHEGVGAPPERRGRRAPSRVGPVARGVAGAPRAGRGAATQGKPATKQPPALEAFFTTALPWSADEIVREYGHRWAVAIPLRDSKASAGLGQDPCRKRQRIAGAHTWRLVMAAARPLWFIVHVDRGTGVPLCRSRPWDRQKVAPSQLDIAEACREALHEAGICPRPRFTPELAENDKEPEYTLPLAAQGAKLMSSTPSV